jgi:TIR domain
MALDPRRIAMIYAASENDERLGSGYFVNHRLVLTAGFLVRESDGEKTDRVLVRQLGTKEWIAARLVWASKDRNMALLEHDALSIESSDVPEFGEITGTNPIHCTAVGFPEFKKRPDRGRDAEQIFGNILPLSRTESGLFDIDLTTSFPSSNPAGSPWAGMSGAAVFVDDYLVGIIVIDPGRVERRLVAAAVAPFITDSGFTNLLKLPANGLAQVTSDVPYSMNRRVDLDQSNPDANTTPRLASPSKDRSPGPAEPDVTYLAGYAADTERIESRLQREHQSGMESRPEKSEGGENRQRQPIASADRSAFVSYSHKDERYRQQLDISLALLRRAKLISVWHDKKILPGQEWDQEIDRNLENADIVLLLVSPDFLASDYAYSREMLRAVERHESRSATVVPIILRPSDWQNSPLGSLEALPSKGRPVSRWSNRDEAWLDVVKGLRRLISGQR